MIYPFVVFALPRSRTTWLSRFLSYGGLNVGHDLGPHANTAQEFFDLLWPHVGTVETGAQDAHRLIRQAMPDAKFVTIHRSPIEVADSLTKFGINQYDEIARRATVLDEIDGMSIEYDSLKDARVCADLWEYLLPGVPFDFQWWRYMDQQNIQIDVPAQLQFLAGRQTEIAKLKADIASNPKITRIGWEPVLSWWPDAQIMLAAHSIEVNNGERHGHPYKMNTALLQQMEQAGVFKIMTARINGTLVGYLSWTILPDTESEGVMIADQGIWYVDPSSPGVGRKLLNRSIAALKAMGLQSVQLHHQTHGRGARLGTMFRRMGAIELQHRYSLWIG